MTKQRKLRVGDIVEVGILAGNDGSIVAGQRLKVVRTYLHDGRHYIDVDTITPPKLPKWSSLDWCDDGKWFILKYNFNDYIRLSNL